MRLTLWLFGRELLSLKACKDEPAATEPPTPPSMEAGSGHNFDRGCGAEDYESDVRAFGFHR